MSESYKRIQAPALNHEFGSNIQETFTNIDDNFGVLANRDFVKGDTGDSLISINVPFSELLSVSGYTGTIDDIAYTIPNQNTGDNGLTAAFTKLRNDLARNRIETGADNDVNYTIGQLSDEANDYSVLVSFQKPTEPGNVTIQSIIPVVYVDQRFWVGNEYAASTIDLSCTITYDGLNQKWVCVQNFPSSTKDMRMR